MAEQPAVWEFVRTRMTVPGVAAAYGYFVDGATPGTHRGLPSRCLTFIISMDDPVRSAMVPDAGGGPGYVSNDVVLGGLHTSPATVFQPRRQRGVQLAVHPLAARRLFGVNAAELGPDTLEGADVLGDEVRVLRESLHELPGWPERFAAIEAFLRRRYERGPANGPRWEVRAAWDWLSRSKGTGTIAQVAAQSCLSSRQLSTLFARELGVAPKTIGNLMRFDNAVTLLGDRVRAGGPLDLGELAVRCGYYDQAHLAREFGRFAGASPSRFVADELRNIQAGGHRPAADWQP